jgi:hypothetical protein
MIAAAVLGLAVFATAPVSPDVLASEAARAAPDCSDGYPRLGCKIWKVSIEIEIGLSPKGIVTCETTDKWACTRDLF